LIGRAAIGNPWIFSGKNKQDVEKAELFSVIEKHLAMMVDLYSEKVAVPIFRKHLVRYLQEFLTTSDIRRRIFTIAKSEKLILEIKNLIFDEENK
jgi:tRNA-dihydrouridine synthase